MLVLSAAVLLTGSLGSIHAFSVFLLPLEQGLGATRSEVGSVYSLALASLTIAVLFGHRIYRLPPPILTVCACAMAGGGLLLAAWFGSLTGTWLGYGLIFGAANGVGYGYALFITNQAFVRRRGIAMGSVTAVYAVGASLFAPILAAWIRAYGTGGALVAMAMVLVLAGIAAAVLLQASRFHSTMAAPASRETALPTKLLALFWAAYGTGVAAGLIAMGHAAGIVSAVGGGADERVQGAMVIALGNALGGFAAGWLADRYPARLLLMALASISALALLGLATTPPASVTITGLAVVGFAYGAIIAIYPVATVLYFGRERYALAYGRIFTAWGMAGLLAPWFAGILFEQTAGYALALTLASLLAVLSLALTWRMPAGAPRAGAEMRFFFFGTLRDRDILEVVLGRRLTGDSLQPAWLADHRLERVGGETFPMLVPAPGVRVEGVTLEDLSAAEIERIGFFEASDYAPIPMEVTAEADGRVAVQVFAATERIISTGEPWRFEDWQREQKSAELWATGLWMDLFGHATIAAAERLWDQAVAAGRPLEDLVREVRQAARDI